jgi:WD40 repeat protein
MGGIVGTPQYMSPEQILGDHQNLDARSDVWSLGVVLYILLTGRSPFAADTMNDVLAGVLTKEIRPPATLEPGVPVELQAITMRALTRDRSARYCNAGDMAKDMIAYQSGERVNAYAYGFLDLMRRFLARHRAAAVVSGVAGCAMLFLAALSYLRVSRARDAALLAERRATAGQQLANTRYADALVEKARAAAATDDIVEAEMLAAEAASVEARPDAKGILASLAGSVRLVPTFRSTADVPCTQTVGTPRADVYTCLDHSLLKALHGSSVRWTVDARNAVSATTVGENDAAVLFADGRWSVYSTSDGRRVAEGALALQHAHTLVGAEHHPWLAAADSQGNVAIWNMQESPVRPILIHWGQPVTAFAFARSRATLVLGGKFGKIAALDFTTPDKRETQVGDAHATILSITIGPRDAHVITGSSDGAVSIWELSKGRFVGNALKRQVGISSLALSEQGRWLLAGTTSSEVDLIDMQQQARVFSVPQGAGQFKPVGFDQNGQVWLTNSASQLSRYAVVEPSPRSMLLDRGNVLSLTWLSGGEFLFSGGLRDSGVCLFRIADGVCLDRVPVQMSQVRITLASPDGRFLFLAGAGSTVQVWDTNTRLPVAVGQVPLAEIRAAAYDGSQTHILVGGVADTLFRFHVASGRVVEQWRVGGHVQAIAVSKSGQSVLLGLRDGRVQQRDSQLRLLGEAQLHHGWVSGIELNPTLDYGVSVGADGKTLFWNPRTLEVLESHQDHTGRVTTIALSADGKYVATGGEDQALILSSARRPWARVAVLRGHRGTIRCAGFDQASRWLASGSDDASVRLWDMSILSANPKTTQELAGQAWGLHMTGPRVARAE